MIQIYFRGWSYWRTFRWQRASAKAIWDGLRLVGSLDVGPLIVSFWRALKTD